MGHTWERFIRTCDILLYIVWYCKCFLCIAVLHTLLLLPSCCRSSFCPPESCGFCSVHVVCRRIQTHIIARAHATNTIFIPTAFDCAQLSFVTRRCPGAYYTTAPHQPTTIITNTAPPTVNHHRRSRDKSHQQQAECVLNAQISHFLAFPAH